MKKTIWLLTLLILVLSSWILYLAKELSDCKKANAETQTSIDAICSLPFVECGTQKDFNQKDIQSSTKSL